MQYELKGINLKVLAWWISERGETSLSFANAMLAAVFLFFVSGNVSFRFTKSC